MLCEVTDIIYCKNYNFYCKFDLVTETLLVINNNNIFVNIAITLLCSGKCVPSKADYF